MKRSPGMSDKGSVVAYLKDVANRTSDTDLKYDVHRCIELLEGKENQECRDLKDVLEEVLVEKEMLFREKCELAVELDHLKSRNRGAGNGSHSKAEEQ